MFPLRKFIIQYGSAAALLALFFGIFASLASAKESAQPPREAFYRPHLLASTGEAAERLRVLTPHLISGPSLAANCVIADASTLKIFWVAPGTEASMRPQFFWSSGNGSSSLMPTVCMFTHIFALKYTEVSSLNYDTGEEGVLRIRVCLRDNTCQALESDQETAQNQALLNALLTLIVASGNTHVVVLDTPWSSIASQPKLARKLYKDRALFDAGLVAKVQSNSPSETAGLRDGDLILRIAGRNYRENLYGEMAALCLMEKPEGCSLRADGLRKDKIVSFNILVEPAFTAEEAERLQTGAPETATVRPARELRFRPRFSQPAPASSDFVLPPPVAAPPEPPVALPVPTAQPDPEIPYSSAGALRYQPSEIERAVPHPRASSAAAPTKPAHHRARRKHHAPRRRATTAKAPAAKPSTAAKPAETKPPAKTASEQAVKPATTPPAADKKPAENKKH